jgi:tryptophan 2,3-dioxygenase
MPDSAPAQQPLNYWDYLKLDQLLALQSGKESDESALIDDELLFIITHQTYELWFKQVARELRGAIRYVGEQPIAEEEVPHVVHHLRRVVAILKLAVEQFSVMETLTPQDFLSFRNKLVPASGFQSFQMRELELLLGLPGEDRPQYGDVDPLHHIRKYGQSSASGMAAIAQVEATLRETAGGRDLRQGLVRWLSRTPIRGSTPDTPGDEATVAAFLDDYHATYCAHQAEQMRHLVAAELAPAAVLAPRFEATSASARRFLFAEDLPEGTPAAERALRRRARAGLLFVESYRHFPLLAWPRLLVDTCVELEQQLVLWRNRHARMVERIIGRRVGTGGSSGVDYLDETTRMRVFTDLWAVRTLLLPVHLLPSPGDPRRYGFAGESP